MEPLVFAQISDLHVTVAGGRASGIVDTCGATRRCVGQLLRLKPAPRALLVTGDLVEHGAAEEYAELRRLLAPLPMPCFVIPGNHDEREALRAAFADHDYLRRCPAYLQYAVEDWPLRIVALDTLAQGEPGGRLCEERLTWLARTLGAAPQRPTLLVMHHPPFRSFIGHMDEMALERPEELAAVLARHPQVERIVCGHLHRAIEARFAGIPVCACPSPAHQVALDISAGAPARFVMEPPAIRLLLWERGAGVVTHLAPVGDYEGPFAFSD